MEPDDTNKINNVIDEEFLDAGWEIVRSDCHVTVYERPIDEDYYRDVARRKQASQVNSPLRRLLRILGFAEA